MSAALSACPMCAETIAEGVDRCPFCGTTFVVTRSGYCAACHAVVVAGGAGTCSVCDGGLLDLQTSAAVRDVPPPPYQQASVTAALAEAAAPEPVALDKVHAWRPYLGRQVIGNAVVAIAVFGLIVGCWFSDWAERPGSFMSVTWRGPLALPVVMLVLHGLLTWRGVGNRRPRGRRTLSDAAWRRRWRQNRSERGVRGAYKPVTWAFGRMVAEALVWLGAAGACATNLTVLGAQSGVSLGAGGQIALVASLAGFVGTLLCLPSWRKQVVLVDSDGVIYGTEVKP